MTVDDEGIHEHRSGRHFASIRWEDLESLSRTAASSDRGTRITLRLAPGKQREFFEAASVIWRQQHPDRWHRDRERAGRAADLAVYFRIPILTLGPSLIGYLMFLITGWPESVEEDLQALHRITALAFAITAGLVIWYSHRKRTGRGAHFH